MKSRSFGNLYQKDARQRLEHKFKKLYCNKIFMDQDGPASAKNNRNKTPAQ